MRFRILIIGLALSLVLRAQFKPEPEANSLESRYDRTTWESPEALLRELRSDSSQMRSLALRLIGYFDDQQDGETPDLSEIQLRYAPIGEDATMQAIVRVTINNVIAHVAVAVVSGSSWERIAAFECWCKYEQTPLETFLSVRPASVTNRSWSELVLHASGGGTGAYVQSEAHFRVRNGGLKRVLSFENRFRECSIEARERCSTARRWMSASTLVEQIKTDPYPQTTTCAAYIWDDKVFLYRRVGTAAKCKNAVTPP